MSSQRYSQTGKMSGLLINFRLSLLKFLLVSIHIFLMFSGKFVWKATERTIFLLQTDLWRRNEGISSVIPPYEN